MAPLTVKLWCLYYHHSLETWVSGIRHVDERGLRDTGGERLQGVGMAQAEQYFAADPQSKDVRKRLHVVLRGNEADVEVSNGVFSGNEWIWERPCCFVRLRSLLRRVRSLIWVAVGVRLR